MTRTQAYKLQDDLGSNPLKNKGPIPHAVVKISGEHYVIHLPTGKCEGTDFFFDLKNQVFCKTSPRA